MICIAINIDGEVLSEKYVDVKVNENNHKALVEAQYALLKHMNTKNPNKLLGRDFYIITHE